MNISLNELEKIYSEIPYPEGKKERVNLIKDILLNTPKEKNGKVRRAQLPMDVFGYQVAIYENLYQQDEFLIFHWVEESWDKNHFELADLLVGVLLHLQLKEVKQFLIKKKTNQKAQKYSNFYWVRLNNSNKI